MKENWGEKGQGRGKMVKREKERERERVRERERLGKVRAKKDINNNEEVNWRENN